jgi:hypothetical protein
MSDQQVKYTITADATQANTELAKVDKAAVSLVGNEQKLATETNKATAALKEQGKAATTSGVSMKSLGDGAKALQQKMAPTAAAISGVGSALGAAGGQAGKFFNAASQGAAAFGAAGPAGLALVAGTLAIDAIATASKEAAIANDVWRAQLEATLPAMQKSRDFTKSMADEANRLGIAVANAGRTEYEVSIARAGAQKAELEAKLANIQATERLRQAAVNDATSQLESARLRGRGIAEAEDRLTLATEVQRSVQRSASEYATQVSSLEDSVWKIADAWATVDSRSKAAAGTAAFNAQTANILAPVGSTAIFDDSNFGGTVETDAEKQEKYRAARELAAENERQRKFAIEQNADKKAEERQKRILDNEKMFDDMRYEYKKKQADALLDIEKSYANQVTDIGKSTFSTALTVGQDYLDAKIQGEKNAELKSVASFLSATGQQLVASGTRAIFEGAIISANPVTPGAGLPMMAMGGLAIAAGIGMGAAGTGVAHTAAGGTIGKELPDKEAAKDKGASPGRGGSGSGGGPLVVNVAYGVGGPLPEDTAREISKAVNTGRRRGGR